MSQETCKHKYVQLQFYDGLIFKLRAKLTFEWETDGILQCPVIKITLSLKLTFIHAAINLKK